MDLQGRTIALIGRLDRLPRRRLAPAITRLQLDIRTRVSRQAAIGVVGHGSSGAVRTGTLATRIERADARGIPLVSENQFLRLIGVLPPLADEVRLYTEDELADWSGLPSHELRLLILFDVLEPGNQRYGFRDLKAAREFGRLLRTTDDFADAFELALALRRKTAYALHLAELNLLAPAPRPDDQLALGDAPQSFDDSWEAALGAHMAGDYRDALIAYRRCAEMRPRDCQCLFNLSAVLMRLKSDAEAETLLRRVVTIKPGFAEAWASLATLRHGEERIRLLEKAVEAKPAHVDSVRMLARAYMDNDDYRRALPLWERFLSLASARSTAVDQRDLDFARRALLLCRMSRMKAHSARRVR